MTLSQYRGRPVILAFYPADWSPVCGDQMALYNEVLPEFAAQGAQLLGISVDGLWCHRAFAEDRRLRFPLLADFEPKGAVARQYGVYRAGDGISERALFLVDGPDGRAVPLPDLKGTLTLLGDARYTTAEAVRWLYTPDDTLVEGRPVDTLRAGRKTEIRRRAQALGF